MTLEIQMSEERLNNVAILYRESDGEEKIGQTKSYKKVYLNILISNTLKFCLQ